MKKIIFSSFLIFVILASSVYFLMPDNVRIDIENTRTKYSVYENDSWVLAATEYVNIYDGTTKMRAKSRELIYWNDSFNVYTQRKSVWKDNITTIQTYVFNKSAENVEDFPTENKFECFNCEGKIVHYEIRDILYEGETKVIESPFSFGHNMKIEWGESSYYSKVFQQKSSDKIIIKYKPNSDYEIYYVRLFDPWTESLNVDLISYFKLEESSGATAVDSVQNNNGTYGGSLPTAVTGIIGNAQNYTTSTDQVSVPNVFGFWTNTNMPFAVNMWVFSEEDGRFQRMVDTNTVEFLFQKFGTGQGCDNCLRSFSAGIFDAQSNISIPTNEWAMITTTSDGSNVDIYINGAIVGTDTTSSSAVSITTTLIGKRIGSTAETWNGGIDETGIWNRSLSVDEIAQLYNEGNGITFATGFPTVTLNSPVDTFNSSSNDVTFNFTAFDDVNLVNVSLYGNWSGGWHLNESNSSGINDTFYIFTKTIPAGTYLWGASATDNEDLTTFSSNRTFTISITKDVNVSVVLPNGFIRFGVCSPDSENADSRPQGQTSSIASINATNNGTATADFKINLTGTANTGWTIKASNDTLVNNITLNTTAQLIGDNVAIGEVIQIHFSANCSFVTQNPGVSIDIRAS